jgi:hypothetical protein
VQGITEVQYGCIDRALADAKTAFTRQGLTKAETVKAAGCTAKWCAISASLLIGCGTSDLARWARLQGPCPALVEAQPMCTTKVGGIRGEVSRSRPGALRPAVPAPTKLLDLAFGI